MQQYPDLELILCSSDNVEDIIQEGFDCVIRTGRIEDSTTLVARPLARYRWMVLASPAWLAAHGRPQSIDELHQHRAVGYLNHRTGRTIDWLFSLDEGDCAIRMRETLVVDDTDAYIQAGIQGLGLIRVASYLAQPYCRAGRWSPVWSRPLLIFPCRWSIRKTAISPPAVRAFYDWSRRVLQPRTAGLMPGHRPGYWPRMACFNFVTSQFSAGSCARRLCRKMHSVNSGYATGGASARSAYCAASAAPACGTVANSGRVVSSRGKVEKFCVAKRTRRASPWLASWRSISPWPVSR
ncbi:hypothetical protein BANRA_00012 [Klebsiella pneumoniae]|nr:LysR substrate-binding domain-containing protein [Klebsiella pneumoniae]VDA52061.1 hypothetical protein BANRA_00012 [Klebsiella pneumoniae]